jgi:NAD(P)-dependent dehydrogenase (short-subunit alcohol dehydrogenase family)
VCERLKGKKALITGSTSGIGKAMALEFARQGAAVVVNGRRQALGEAVTADIREQGGEAYYFKADISKDDEVADMADFAGKTMGGLDILVNNAVLPGAGRSGRLSDPPGELWRGTQEELWDAMYRVGLRGSMLCSKLFMPYLVASGKGSIINISSIHGLRGFGWDSYSMVKGGLISLTMSMAAGYARDRVRVNCICPGAVATERLTEIYAQHPDRLEQNLRNTLTRLGRAQDIAYCAVYLASDEAEYVTGSVLSIDGGWAAKGSYTVPNPEL